jgi:hypothetical protein
MGLSPGCRRRATRRLTVASRFSILAWTTATSGDLLLAPSSWLAGRMRDPLDIARSVPGTGQGPPRARTRPSRKPSITRLRITLGKQAQRLLCRLQTWLSRLMKCPRHRLQRPSADGPMTVVGAGEGL